MTVDSSLCEVARDYEEPDFDIEELELDLDSPIGEKAWPLRLAIPAMLKFIGKVYVVVCTGFTSLYIIIEIVKVLR